VTIDPVVCRVPYFEYGLVLNQFTARGIGLGLPPALVLRASKAVE